MQILHVTPYFEGAWAYGGIPRAASATVHGLVQRGHDLTVCTTDACRPDARLPRAQRQTGRGQERPDVQIFRNLSNRAAYDLQLFLPVGLSRFLRENAARFDIGHIHGCHHLPGVLAARYFRRAGVPYVLTPHGTAPYIERRRAAKRVFDRTIGRRVLPNASRMIAVSQAERAQLAALGVIEERISVLPNPLNVSEFKDVVRGEFRRRMGIPAHQPLVLYLGKLTPRKRLDTLVEAFARLRLPAAKLVIAGNDMGYGRQLGQLITRFGIGDRTLVTGLLPGASRLCALADADVVSYASELEVFGLVPVEALLCGTPVVVADDCGCGEVIKETGGGLLVAPGNPVELADALAAILGDREHWRARAALARNAAAQYSSEAVCAALETIYRQVLANPSPAQTPRAGGRADR